MSNLQQILKYDVAIVGASIAGTTATTLFAREGLRVALLERNKDINAYKKVGTHFIQSDVMPTMRRLGIAEAIEAAGGVRNGGKTWTRYGWIGGGVNAKHYGYNIRRQILDPLLHRHAAATQGVDFLLGTSLRELIYNDNRVVGLRANGPNKESIEIHAQLVVGADGRYSPTAELAGLPAKVDPNQRFIYFAHFRNLPLVTGQSSQVWQLEPNVAYAMPNDNGITVLALMLPKSELAEFKRDVQGNFIKFFETLPNGPNLRAAEQVTEMRGMLNMPNISRTTTAPGLALVGDAALTSDPLWGNGIGRAFQSAEWLVDRTARALRRGRPDEVDQALAEYRQHHHSTLAGRHARDVDYSRARSFNFLERLMYSAATRNRKLARYTGPYSTRLVNIRYYPPFKAIVRALWTNLTYHIQTHVAPSVPSWAQMQHLFAKAILPEIDKEHRHAGSKVQG